MKKEVLFFLGLSTLYSCAPQDNLASPEVNQDPTITPTEETANLPNEPDPSVTPTQALILSETPYPTYEEMMPNKHRFNFSTTETPVVSESKMIIHPGEIIYKIKTSQNKFLLTWDDAGDPEILVMFLNQLDTLGVRGTFAFPAKFILDNPDLVYKVKMRGHDVILHGWNHENFGRIPSLEEAVILYDRMVNAYSSVLRHKPSFERKPYGSFGDVQHKRWLTEVIGPKYGLAFSQWNKSLGDGDKQGELSNNRLLETIDYERKIMIGIEAGDNLLGHWMSKATRQGLPEFIEITKRKGLSLAAISEIVEVK